MQKHISKRNGKKKIIITMTVILLLWILCFYLYITYNNIEIYDGNYTTTKTQSTHKEQTVDNIEENSKKVSDVIEETINCVVGISKLKNAGTSIFSENTENQLGLGTGIIVTENGYILSNEHVAGSKYSKCYITLENGKNYEGTVVWSDTIIDLAIIKIGAENLNCVNLGNSDNIKIGEKSEEEKSIIYIKHRRTL